MAELRECKRRLAEVVDEVLFCESENEILSRKYAYLKQALSDSTASHAAVIKSFQEHFALVHRNNDNDAGKKNNRDSFYVTKEKIGKSMAELRRFQEALQRGLVSESIELPRTMLPVEAATGSLLQSFENDADAFDKQLEEAASREKKWEKEKRDMLRKIETLEEDLEVARSEMVWPFKDNRSEMDQFGMSSNSFDANQVRRRRLSQEEKKRSQYTDIGVQSDNSPRSSLGLTMQADTVERLKDLLTDERKSFEKQKSALIKQARIELEDAEAKIFDLRQELEQERDKGENLSQINVEVSQQSKDMSFLRNIIEKTNSNSDSNITESVNFALSLYQDNDVDSSSLLKRISELENALTNEKMINETTKREFNNAVKEKSEALDKLQHLERESTLSFEEMKTERSHINALKLTLEKAQRDRETLASEQRAADKRHVQIVEEMRKAKVERDQAITQAEEYKHNVKKAENMVKKLESDLRSEKGKLEDMIKMKNKLSREKQNNIQKLEANERAKATLMQEISMLQRHKEIAEIERDAAIEEKCIAMERVDQAIEDLKKASELRDKAMSKSNLLESDMCQAEHVVTRLKEDLNVATSKIKTLENLLDTEESKIGKLKKQLEQTNLEREKQDEAISRAFQEREIAERQYQALTREMKSVLRLRDIALQQRDMAVKDSHKDSIERDEKFTIEDSRKGKTPKQKYENQTVQRLKDQCEKAKLDEKKAKYIIEKLEEEIRYLKHARKEHDRMHEDSSNAEIKIDDSEFSSRQNEKVVQISRILVSIQRAYREVILSLQNIDSGANSKFLISSDKSTVALISQSINKNIEDLCDQALSLRIDALSASTLAKSVSNNKVTVKDENILQVHETKFDDQLGKEEIEQLKRTILEQAREIRLLSSANTDSNQHVEKVMESTEEETTKPNSAENHQETKNLEFQLQKSEKEKSKVEKQLKEERNQLVEALSRLKIADEKIKHLENLLQDYKKDFLDSERELLLQEVDSAASQLRLVAKDKYNAVAELEQVYDTLAKLETQLEATKIENSRLKEQIACISFNTTSEAIIEHSDEGKCAPPSKLKRPAVKSSIHIRRDGTVVIGS